MPNDMSPVQHERAFTITKFLEGKTRAWGIFEDRFGNVKLHLSVEMYGSWSGDKFILSEEFNYEDGRQEHREWHVKQGAEGQFTATCADCIGHATGNAEGGIIAMRYRFRLKLKGRVVHVNFFDRLIKIDEQRAVNRAIMSKWGIKLGELSLFFEKDTAQ